MYKYLLSLLVSLSMVAPAAYARQEPKFKTTQDEVSENAKQSSDSEQSSDEAGFIKTSRSTGGGGGGPRPSAPAARSGGGGGGFGGGSSRPSAPTAPVQTARPAQSYQNTARPTAPAPQVQARPPVSSSTNSVRPAAPAPSVQATKPAATSPVSSGRPAVNNSNLTGVGRYGKPAAEHQQVAPAALNRTNKRGVNSQEPIAGKKVDLPGGRTKIAEHDAKGNPTGREAIYSKNGTINSMTKKDGTHVKYDESGKAKQIKSPNGNEVNIHKDGARTLTRTTSDGTKLQTKLDHNGNIRSHESIRTYNGQSIKQRTTIINNTTVITNYHGYNYGGHSYYGYHPYYGYSPFFYSGYMYGGMWGVPYSYGWGGYPGCGFYSSCGWYSPYSYYYSPWTHYGEGYYIGVQYPLLDLMFLSMIQAHHEREREEALALAQQQQQQPTNYVEAAPVQQQQQPVAQQGQTIDEATKLEIANQVKDMIDAHKKQETVPLSETLVKMNYNYIVGDDDVDGIPLTIDPATGEQVEGDVCELTKGDILVLDKKHSEDKTTVIMRVKSSKRTSCKPKTVVEVSLEEVQAMQNSLAETLDKGILELSKKAGKGLPAAPAGVDLSAKETIPADANAIEEAKKAAEAAKADADKILADANANDAPPAVEAAPKN